MANEQYDPRHVAQCMMEMAEERGLLPMTWRKAGWWEDADKLRDAVAMVGYSGAMRIAVQDASGRTLGGVWAGWNPIASRPMHFAVCAANVAPGVLGVDNLTALGAMRKETGAAGWVSWWDALSRVQKAARVAGKGRFAVGDWIGGVTTQGAVLGMVIEEKDGAPVQLQAGEQVFRAPPGVSWFKWASASRIAAAEDLAMEGEALFPGYLTMRAKVVARARQLIARGEVENDPARPIKMEWKRGRKPKA